MMVIVRIAVLVVAAVLGLLLLLNWETLSERARGDRGNGAPQITLVTSEARIPATRSLPLFPEPLGRMGGLRPHACPHEDGDPLARQRGYAVPCVWTNPRTGLGYFIDSAEYLN